jgi:release factor glutamine methyltransferase
VKTKQALNRARDRLAGHGDSENATLESEVLLRHILQIDRVQLYLDLEKELDPDREAEFQQIVERRLQGEPLAYIIRHREFFGLDFYVDERVLIPRPESEHLVEEAINCTKGQGVLTIADIGTGSGAIAISLAVHLPQVRIFATDISSAALEVACVNAQKHAVQDRVTLLQGDLLGPLPEPVNIIVANLPYIKNTDIDIMPSAGYEPVSALKGGTEGLDQIFRLVRQIKGKLQSGGCFLLEIGMGQSQATTDFVRKLYPSSSIEVIRDLAWIDRVVIVTL